MNLKEQEYVCALAENGTITAAAKELFISQPALSIYINNLEKSLGVRLFERVVYWCVSISMKRLPVIF